MNNAEYAIELEMQEIQHVVNEDAELAIVDAVDAGKAINYSCCWRSESAAASHAACHGRKTASL